MSIKIYYAWRVPIERLHEATDWWHDYFEEKAIKMFEDLSEKNQAKEIWRRRMETLDLFYRVSKQVGVRDNPLDVNSGFSFWILEGYVYMTPFGLRGWMPNRDMVPDWFEDYHYQNQVDSDNTEEEDEKRRKTWEKMILGEGRHDQFARMYVHTAVDIERFPPLLFESKEEK